MIKYIKFLIISILTIPFSLEFIMTKHIRSKNKIIKIAFLDTQGTEKYLYQPFIKISEQEGFKIAYKSIANLMDINNTDLKLEKYDGIFLSVGIEFIKGIFSKSRVSKKILNLIEKFSAKKNKLVGLILPTTNARNKLLLLKPIFTKIGLDLKNCPDFVIALNYFLSFPLETKSFLYHTTLKCPQLIQIPSLKETKGQQVVLLPKTKKGGPEIKPTIPYGIYFLDKQKNNHFFITALSLAMGLGICENFNFCPMDEKLRKQILNSIKTMFSQLYLTLNGKTYKNSTPAQKPDNLEPVQASSKKKLSKKTKFRKIAWMEINLFDKKKSENAKQKEERQKSQNFLIESLLRSGNDLVLWITFSPNSIYSPIGTFKSKENEFWNKIRRFSKKLILKSNELKVNTPKISVGFEISRNLYKPNLPKVFAEDLYGNKYLDIPSPINKTFWKNEVITPYKKFISRWKNEEFINQIKIMGIVIDLEMYLKSSGIFLSTMGFNPNNINEFIKTRENGENIRQYDFSKGINYLTKNNQTKNFFKFLNKKAIGLGTYINKSLQKENPKINISLYMPNLRLNWFYLGLCKGLCLSNKRIQLLTFNSDFNSHKKWIQNRGINLRHYSVLMLSKLENKKDFKFVDQILKRHDGIWLNKFSRFAEQKHKNWMSIEQDNLNIKNKLNFFRYLKNH